MNEQDKQRVEAAKKRKSGARTTAEKGVGNLQDQIKQSAENAGHLAADNFTAQMLVTMMTDLQQGRFGEKTTAILEAFSSGSTAPLEEWGNQLTAWNQPAILSASVESGG